MALRHKKKKDERYDEGLIRGQKALLIGIFPVFIFLGTMVVGAWLLVDYYNKVTVNQDDSDSCKLVRKHYPSSVRADYPCGVTDRGDNWLVSFNQNPGSGSAPAYISFTVDKASKRINPASSTK